ncbi:HTH domain-containing protein, XRE-family [Dehalococcoides mccartyi BTF08]|uniref:helix-turn-helix domain-containing protein n=1 Tax=Dehalococcoides mccartyi TaxID=61435 RepID=UPI0002B768C3|nr:helix-turn-helix transcriptional regulator [Dehalococcoides mccartyi]AGG07346.1 HTH domain-containing protein, XRE-family [Dehalococcoides mccartyi BTF08]
MSAICYKRLWKLLIDREMKKSDLQRSANISQTTMTKLSKGQNLTTDILARICLALNCEIEDICEVNKNSQ